MQNYGQVDLVKWHLDLSCFSGTLNYVMWFHTCHHETRRQGSCSESASSVSL